MGRLILLPTLKGQARDGFTLIELLVSVTILILLVGVSVSSFISFNERQQLAGAAKELQGLFRSAQARARNGDVPPDCGTLTGYKVQMATDNSIVDIIAVCSNGDITRNEKTLSGGVRPTAAIDMTFLTLRGGVTNPTDITLTLVTGLRTYSFKVTEGGEISGGSFNE